MGNKTSVETSKRSRGSEMGAFLFLDVIVLPAIILGVLGAYALGVWLYDTYAGFQG